MITHKHKTRQGRKIVCLQFQWQIKTFSHIDTSCAVSQSKLWWRTKSFLSLLIIPFCHCLSCGMTIQQSTREYRQKRDAAKYSWPPSSNQSSLAVLSRVKTFLLFSKRVIFLRNSTVPMIPYHSLFTASTVKAAFTFAIIRCKNASITNSVSACPGSLGNATTFRIASPLWARRPRSQRQANPPSQSPSPAFSCPTTRRSCKWILRLCSFIIRWWNLRLLV